MVSRFPHASCSSHLPSILPSVPAACFLFLVGCCFSNIHQWPYKAKTYFCIYICLTLSSPPQTMVRRHPTHSAQVMRPPGYPPHRDHGLLVGYCVVCSNSGHLRPRPRPFLCFSRGCVSAPQTKEPTMARAQPTPRAFYGPIGEQQRQDLGPWRMLSWRERAKAAEGSGGGGSCWLLCVVAVFCAVARNRVRFLPIL